LVSCLPSFNPILVTKIQKEKERRKKKKKKKKKTKGKEKKNLFSL